MLKRLDSDRNAKSIGDNSLLYQGSTSLGYHRIIQANLLYSTEKINDHYCIYCRWP